MVLLKIDIAESWQGRGDASRPCRFYEGEKKREENNKQFYYKRVSSLSPLL
jgi:hypothetical protein